MKKKYIFTTGIVAVLICCLSFIGSSVMAGSRNAKFAKIIMEDLTSLQITGQAFNVNVTDSFLIVDQTKIYVVENITLKSGEKINTVITDENQKRIPLSEIKDYQRVEINAYRSQDGCTIAAKIKKLPNLTKDKLGPNVVPQ